MPRSSPVMPVLPTPGTSPVPALPAATPSASLGGHGDSYGPGGSPAPGPMYRVMTNTEDNLPKLYLATRDEATARRVVAMIRAEYDTADCPQRAWIEVG